MSLSETALFKTADGKTRTLGEHKVFATPERILMRTRELMAGGVFRPNMGELCKGIITPLSIHKYFETTADLYSRALDDQATRTLVLARLMPNGPWPASDDCDRILRAIVSGRLPQ
jgi:hypothetical protein